MPRRTATLAKRAVASSTAASVAAGEPTTTVSKSHLPSPNEIRTLAYVKWTQAGRPAGDGAQFWLEAERELKQRK